jgi:hypothetical protein
MLIDLCIDRCISPEPFFFQSVTRVPLLRVSEVESYLSLVLKRLVRALQSGLSVKIVLTVLLLVFRVGVGAIARQVA